MSKDYGRIPPDIEIAQGAKLKPILEIAKSIGLTEDDLEFYGKYMAKVSLETIERLKERPYGKLIYTTAITATPAGEGKTCTAVGLTQALGRMNKKVMVALREPSLGPTFGIKGGAAGGGYSQVLPMEDINLISPVISMQWAQPITSLQPWWKTISIKGMTWG